MSKSRGELSPFAALAKAKAAAKRGRLESEFTLQLRGRGLTGFVRQYRFHPTRGWRFDFAQPALRLAVEVDGGTATGGRHVRPAGFEEDCRKLNAAAALGWTVLRGTSAMLRRSELIDAVADLYHARMSQSEPQGRAR